MQVSLTVTCHLHFWQNNQDLLHATAVTQEWSGYRNKSQHRKLTLEKKVLPPVLPGFEPATFRLRVRRSVAELSSLPHQLSLTLLPSFRNHAITSSLLSFSVSHTSYNRFAFFVLSKPHQVLLRQICLYMPYVIYLIGHL